ncbi:hypothetical protein IPL85_02210 [Candidatus Saccharibacteria bacterium]|nr:MAG: hypothetical protein IPL85_02210 [Candidatus Saccharibacteria bacterium]
MANPNQSPNPHPAANTPEADAVRLQRQALAAHVPRSSFHEVKQQWNVLDAELENRQKTEADTEAYNNSPERVAQIEAYNDEAELRIFGSSGRTYTDAQGNVIADAQNPRHGLVDGAKERADALRVEPDDAKHLPQPARDTLTRKRNSAARKEVKQAEEEVKEILDLQTSEGLSLSQADLIVRLRREVDPQEKDTFVQRRIADLEQHGVSSAAAKRRAKQEADSMYARKDAARLKAIKKNNVHSVDEYGQLLTGGGANNTSRSNSQSQPGENRPGVDAVIDEAYAENDAIYAERMALSQAAGNYTALSANMRNGHLGRLAPGRSRLRRLRARGPLWAWGSGRRGGAGTRGGGRAPRPPRLARGETRRARAAGAQPRYRGRGEVLTGAGAVTDGRPRRRGGEGSPRGRAGALGGLTNTGAAGRGRPGASDSAALPAPGDKRQPTDGAVFYLGGAAT